MLELSALGLLQQEPLHGYRLKQRLELFLSSCMSVNYGAIYPLLKRLEERGQVQVLLEESGDGGASRKIYAVTAAGCDRWREQMLEHPQESWVKSRARFLVKYFFFGSLEPGERVQLIEIRLRVCYQRKTYLDSQEMGKLVTDSFQVATWERAKVMLESEMDWLHECLEKEKSTASTSISGKM
ncbi:PadR family transcriptional regulator [Planktothrix paucivesiculata]|uniref:Transcriptional regulator, PadR-like family n=1 Tax=Planktothrix paucivesiculata PCC 9631 TaxID=671071 RepID=A0A7Z9C1M3_9CYAN|nr:PadR family transcriptional regulator [Planktothrix paucivesiculata]VXD25393.1 Transcriptional regulator, PadR-like family [Planktothrix paucivesiculata PCC 9631]